MAASLNYSDTVPHRVAVLLLPDFPLMAFSSTIEPLRAANLLHGDVLFEWRCLSLDGSAVVSSCGIRIDCDEALGQSTWAQTLIVCAGPLLSPEECKHYHSGLNQHAQRDCTLAGFSSGAVLLGSAGLLDGYRCTAHWEFIDSFAERFPRVEVVDQLYVIDRKRLTCSGGTAALDMMLGLISQEHGSKLSIDVAHWFMHDKTRDADERQHKVEEAMLARKSAKLAAAIQIMRANLEDPVAPKELARQVCCSLRQLERLFKQHQETTLQSYYVALRLDQARRYITQTGLPLFDIVVAVGFTTQSYFSKCYRDRFGISPTHDRKKHSELGQQLTSRL